VPIYSYRCRACGGATDAYASVNDAPTSVACEHCHATDTYKIIGRVAYHANEATKTARLDSKFEKRVDDAMRKSAGADPNRLLRKMKPFGDAKKD
jgi:putative FmdB family regulatory protein